MRVFLTGGTGFIGTPLATTLRRRGNEVVALVRSPAKGAALAAVGCELIEGTVTDTAALQRGMAGADAVIHAAGLYEVGIPKRRRPALFETNVEGTRRVMTAAADAGIARVVYVSTVNALGNTHGEVGDETTEHHGRYVSTYDETKHQAHEIAEQAARDGLPCVIAMPSAVYGPGDHSQIGVAIRLFLARRMPAVPLPGTGLSFVYLDDVVTGLVAVLDSGVLGEKYILSGENSTMRGLIETLASVTGRRAPRLDVPTGLLRLIAPLGPVVGPPMGMAPNIRELITAGDGVTYWARHDKATAELGYRPRSLIEGLRTMLAAQERP